MDDIKKIYLSNFLFGISAMSSVTFTLFLLGNNMTQSQISLLFAVLMITTAIFQIPTGAFADKFGCKKSVYIGQIFHALSFLILVFARNFNDFLISMIIAGIGISLESGAFSTLIFRILKDKKEQYDKIWSRSNAFYEISMIFSAPLGAYIFKYHERYPYIISFIAILFSALLVILVKSKDENHEDNAKKSYFRIIKYGMKLTFINPKLIAITILGSSFMMIGSLMNNNINQPYQLSIGNDIPGIGIVASIVSIIFAVIFYFNHRIISKIKYIRSLLLIIFTTSLSLIVLGLNYTFFIGIFFLLIFNAIQGFRFPILNSLMQKEAHDDHRSTIASTIFFLNSIAAGIFLPIWGQSIDNLGLRITLIVLGIFILISGLIGILIYNLNFKKNLSVTKSELSGISS